MKHRHKPVHPGVGHRGQKVGKVVTPTAPIAKDQIIHPDHVQDPPKLNIHGVKNNHEDHT